MRELRTAGVREAGITLNLSHVTAASDSAADLAALARAETMQKLMWTEPLLRGRHPSAEEETWGELVTRQTFRQEGDLELISTPMDFLGINY